MNNKVSHRTRAINLETKTYDLGDLNNTENRVGNCLEKKPSYQYKLRDFIPFKGLIEYSERAPSLSGRDVLPDVDLRSFSRFMVLTVYNSAIAMSLIIPAVKFLNSLEGR